MFLYFWPLKPCFAFFLTYVVVVFLELWIAFPTQRISTYMKAWGLMYLVSFCMGGFLKWVESKSAFAARYGRSILYLAGAIYFFTLCVNKISGLVKRERREKRELRLVRCQVNGKKICCTGLWDTGNSLFDPISGKPVLVLEKEELMKHSVYIRKEKFRVIPFHSLGTKNGFLEAFVADYVQIETMDEKRKQDTIEREDVIIGVYEGKLSRDGSYQMILHPGI